VSEQTPVETTDTQASTNTVDKQETTETNASKTGSGSALGWFNFLLIILLSGLIAVAGWYGWQHHHLLVNELAQLKASQNSSQTQAAQQANQQQKQLAELQKTQQELIVQLAQNSEALAQIPTAGRQDWLLAEAEYLLRIANQRLQLEKDWSSALSMLQAADNVLVEAKNPRMNSVRALIADEVIALRKAPSLDVQGAVLRLQALQKELPALPWIPNKYSVQKNNSSQQTATENITADVQNEAWYVRVWNKISNALTGLVRIRVHQDGAPQPLSPDQQYYLEQNMHLMLEQAQAALLREEEDLYQHSLQRVVEWMQNYLIVEDASTEAALLSVQELLEWPVAPARPDISGSLLKLQSLLEQQQRGSVNSNDMEEAQ